MPPVSLVPNRPARPGYRDNTLSGYTTAIVASDLRGAIRGIDANAAFLLSVTRAAEICLGIVCAGVVLAGTDLGGASPVRSAA